MFIHVGLHRASLTGITNFFCNFTFSPLYLILGAHSSYKHLIVSLCQSAIQLLLYVFVFVAAAQMWCFARTPSLLIGDVIPESVTGRAFFAVLKIEEIVFSPASSTQLAAFLVVLIEQYLDDFGTYYITGLTFQSTITRCIT